MDGFRLAIEDVSLSELPLTGGKYTWERSKGKDNWVRERLDRCFASDNWWQLFPLCKLSVYHTIYSDHEPINLDICNVQVTKKQFRFKFENTWLRESEFNTEVKEHLASLPRLHLLPKLLSLSSFMAKWGMNFFHKFKVKIRKQKEVLNKLVDEIDEESVKQYFEERDKLNVLLVNKEVYCKQKAKVFWLKEGDSNSKFFHAYASARKRTNFINHLRTDESDLVTDTKEMHSVVVDYFNKLLDGQKDVNYDDDENRESLVSDEQNQALMEDITFEEFTRAVKQMHPDKASGPDGLNPAFFSEFLAKLG